MMIKLEESIYKKCKAIKVNEEDVSIVKGVLLTIDKSGTLWDTVRSLHGYKDIYMFALPLEAIIPVFRRLRKGFKVSDCGNWDPDRPWIEAKRLPRWVGLFINCIRNKGEILM